ncbi:MAG: Gfo/Idh/MocA family protein [Roseiflexaceae bacterium]|jgi:predicted dehydrogenase|nr:Gfo/Idh/MocA family oxidoreductase [Chloroflexaceae bacterium]
MMRPLRIGVVGCGPIAQAGHFPAIVKAHNAQLYAIADHSARLRAYAAAVHQPDVVYADASELFADPAVDAVVIAVADQFHVPLTQQAIAAGKHVLVEKPLGVDVASCQALVQLAAQTPLILQVGNNKRFDPGIAYAHDMAHHHLGARLAYRGWYCDSHYRYTVTDNVQPTIMYDTSALRPAGNPKADRRRYLLLTHGSHLVDTARYICGPITRVQTRLLQRDESWCWFSAVTFADGALGHLDLTVTIRGDHHEGFHLYAGGGSIIAKTYLPWYLKSSDVDVFTHHDQQYHRPLGADGHSYKRQIEGFVAAINGQPQRGATLVDGLAAVQVLTAMSMSAAADGATIEVTDAVGEP